MLQRDIKSTNSTIYEYELHRRIQAEYAEMPGMRLTLPQASRLFNLERTVCERVLGTLVERRVLSQSGTMFVRCGAN